MVGVIGRTDYEGNEFTCNSDRRPCIHLFLAVGCVLLDVKLKGSDIKDCAFNMEEGWLKLNDVS